MAKESYPRRPERDLWPCLYFFPVKTLLPFAAIALLLPLGACGGSLSIGGPLWIFGDGGDDDDSAGGGDDDDASDDDDTTPPSGPVVCGPTVQPGSSWEGTSTEGYTGDAVLTFEYEERGGLFSADWSGCEAKHFFGPDGESECGILWSAEGKGSVRYDGSRLEPGTYALLVGPNEFSFRVASAPQIAEVEAAVAAAKAATASLDPAAATSVVSSVYLQAGMPGESLRLVDEAIAASPEDADLEALLVSLETQLGLRD